jgi:hypothetical protein
MNTTQWRGSRKLMQGRWSHLVTGVSSPTWRLLQKLVLQLVKRPLVDRGRIGLRDASEGESGKKASAKEASGNETEKAKKAVRGKFKCPNCGELGHRKTQP